MSNVLKRPTEAMHGTLISADFPDDTITLEMEPGYYTAKMRFAVVPADEYTRQCEQRAELLAELKKMVATWRKYGDAEGAGYGAGRAIHHRAKELEDLIANATQQRNATGGEG